MATLLAPGKISLSSIILVLLSLPFLISGLPVAEILTSLLILPLYVIVIVRSGRAINLISALIFVLIIIYSSFLSKFTSVPLVLVFLRTYCPLAILVTFFFLFPRFKYFFASKARSILRILILSTLFSFLLNFFFPSSNAYGGIFNLYLNDSSSYNAIAGSLYLFALLSVAPLCLSTNKPLFLLRFIDKLLVFLTILYLALAILNSGSRIGFLGFLFILLMIVVQYQLKFIIFAFLFSAPLIYSVFNSSFAQVIWARSLNLLSSGLLYDARFEKALIVGGDFFIQENLVNFTFGHGLGSLLINWNSSSSADSTIRYMLFSFGLIGLIAFLTAVLFVFHSAYSDYRLIAGTSRSIPSTRLHVLILYLLMVFFFSLTNEIVSLKSFPSAIVITYSLLLAACDPYCFSTPTLSSHNVLRRN